MGADEIMDWKAFELTRNPEFIEKLQNTPKVYDKAEAEADAIRKMFMGLQK
jgi:hypothetical protein